MARGFSRHLQHQLRAAALERPGRHRFHQRLDQPGAPVCGGDEDADDVGAALGVLVGEAAGGGDPGAVDLGAVLGAEASGRAVDDPLLPVRERVCRGGRHGLHVRQRGVGEHLQADAPHLRGVTRADPSRRKRHCCVVLGHSHMEPRISKQGHIFL